MSQTPPSQTPPILTADDARTLAAVLDAIVPPRDDGRLPGAGALGVGAHVERMLAQLAELRPVVTDGLHALGDVVRRRGGATFAALEPAEQQAALQDVETATPGFLPSLVFLTYGGYYADPRVVAALGLEPRAPFPRGYEVPETDFGLLEAVRRRGPRWRQC